jgi:hypothetical protein
MLRVLDTCGHVGYLPHSKAGNRLHYLGQLPQENAAETLVVALLSQISDLDEERVMTIDRTLSQTSLFYEVIHEQMQLWISAPVTQIVSTYSGRDVAAGGDVVRAGGGGVIGVRRAAGEGWKDR